MSQIVVEVVEQNNTVSTSSEEIAVEVTPSQAPSVDISEDQTTLEVSEQAITLEITQPAPIQIIVSEMIKDSGGGSADDANRIEVTRVVTDMDVTQYDPVALVTADDVRPSTVDTLNNATVFGVALHSALIGEEVRILIFGIVSDPIFVYPLNVPLFNSSTGNISQTATTIVGEFFCRVGKSNGAGSVLVDPDTPTEVF